MTGWGGRFEQWRRLRRDPLEAACQRSQQPEQAIDGLSWQLLEGHKETAHQPPASFPSLLRIEPEDLLELLLDAVEYLQSALLGSYHELRDAELIVGPDFIGAHSFQQFRLGAEL